MYWHKRDWIFICVCFQFQFFSFWVCVWESYLGSPFLVSSILVFLVGPILGFLVSPILGFLVGPILGFEVLEVEEIQEI